MGELKTITEATQYIKIMMGQEQYGIEIKHVDNIVRMQTITRVPKIAHYLKGVINIRGEIIPIMSLRLKMGLPEVEETKATRIIILRLESNDMLGLIVDEVKDVISLYPEEIEKVLRDPKNESANFLSGIGKDKDNLISLLDINEVITDKNNPIE